MRLMAKCPCSVRIEVYASPVGDIGLPWHCVFYQAGNRGPIATNDDWFKVGPFHRAPALNQILRRESAAGAGAFNCRIIPKTNTVVSNLKAFLVAFTLALTEAIAGYIKRVGKAGSFNQVDYLTLDKALKRSST